MGGPSEEKLAQNFTWIGDNLGAPDAYGMGLDIDACKRQVDKISAPLVVSFLKKSISNGLIQYPIKNQYDAA